MSTESLLTSSSSRSSNEALKDVQGFVLESSSTDQSENITYNEIVLSVYWKRGKLGAAYYSTDDADIHILNDIVDTRPDFKNLRCLLNQVQYSLIVTCRSLSDAFKKILMELVIGSHRSDTEINYNISLGEGCNSKKINYISGKKNDLNYDACRRLILGQRFSFEPKFSDEEEHLLFMNSHIDFKKECMVMSLGILLHFLQKYVPQKNLNRAPICISMLQQINLENIVSIDEASYQALQIFHIIHHPSAFKRNNQKSNREGLSVFGIFNRCKSRIGTRRMRHIFTNPIKDISELNSRLDTVEFCCKTENEQIVRNLTNCIKKVESVTGILTSIYRSRSNISHWKSLYCSLYNAILIGQICTSHSSQSGLFLKIARSITKSVHEVTHYINRVIDFEESLLRNQFTVRVGVDSTLDKLRETYGQVPKVLEKVAAIELGRLPEFIGQCTIVYITELGYLLSVPIWTGDGENTADYQLPDFEVKFVVNKCVYYKTLRCIELDNILGDVLAIICKTESKIMVALMEFIHERVPDIVQAINLIAELDCIIAMAEIAMENGYNRPILTQEKKIEIEMGRHPLQELCVDNFVPNDADFNAESGVVKILTGPNASGKSVYLKQVAVIAFLAHIGSFVPAQRAVIPILDHIHSRIHTLESISTRMSSFILDLKQMSHAFYNSTPTSLITVDEFGKGTTEIDGLSLLAASLIHFIEREGNCPFILVSTHFHELPKLLPNSPLIGLQYMDYVIENEEIAYLHKIKNGTCNSSLSYLAAKSAGFNEKSVERFMQILKREEKPVTCNTNLEITKLMLREMVKLKRLLEKSEMSSIEGTSFSREK